MEISNKKKFFDTDIRELLSHSKNYVSAELLTKGLSFLALPIFTRLMSPNEYGIMEVFISLVSILSILFGLGVRGAITRYYYESHRDFFDYYSSVFWLVLLSGFIFVGLSFLFPNQLHLFFHIPKGMIYISLIIVLPQIIFQIYLAYLQAAKKSKKVASLNVIGALLSIGVTTFFMFQMKEEKYYARAIGQGVGFFTLFFISLWYIKDKLKFSIKKRHIQYSLVFGLPIILHLLSQNILTSFDQIIINQLIGAQETGIYSVAYKIGMVQNIITMGILKSWTPIFYRKMNEGKYSDINTLAKKYGFIVVLVAVFLIFFSTEIITILADKAYSEALFIVPIIVISYYFFFLYTMYVGFAFYEKKTKNIALITIIAGTINILLNYLLIPKYGYIAAAWTTCFSYLMLFLLHYINAKWILGFKRVPSVKIFLLPLLILIVVSSVNYVFVHYSVDFWLSFILRVAFTLGIVSLTIKNIRAV